RLKTDLTGRGSRGCSRCLSFKGDKPMRSSIATAMLLCLVFSCLVFSQVGNSQLGGVVTDPSGALMPGVTVTVINGDTSITNTAITNESGAYNFPSLQPGSKYSVSASLPGFQR